MCGRGQDAAACIIRDEEGRVLLVHQRYGQQKWTLPGGQVEAGESAWAAVIRECQEELAVTVQPVLAGLYFLPHRAAYLFVFQALAYAGTPTPDGVEIVEAGYYALDQLPSPISSFTVQRLKDCAANHPHVVMADQSIEAYRIGGRSCDSSS